MPKDDYFRVSTFGFLLSSFYFRVSTFGFLLLSFYFWVSTFGFLLSSFDFWFSAIPWAKIKNIYYRVLRCKWFTDVVCFFECERPEFARPLSVSLNVRDLRHWGVGAQDTGVLTPRGGPRVCL